MDSADLPEGTRLLDRYVILDRVAAGGMAWIHRATDERLDRVVCVKLFRLVVEDEGSREYKATYAHFLEEARAFSRLQHPSTLRIYDFGFLEGGRPFQICEFLDGGTLESHVRRRGALRPEETLGILEDLCGAIAEAHSHGIIHRDIKPTNVFFARVGDSLMPKLGDFGIAHSNLQPAEGERESFHTVALFSPCWAAPEQLSGAPESPATDVYALGLLTAFMLAGRPTFRDKDVASTFAERIRGDALVGSRLSSMNLGGEVGRLLRDATTADPRVRISSPRAFLDRMRESLGTIRATQPPLLTPTPMVRPDFGLEIVPQKSNEQPAAKQRDVRTIGSRTVRFVDVPESVDFSFVDARGAELRFSVTIFPTPRTIRLKGLNCFVAPKGGRPNTAMFATADGSLEFVASSGRPVGGLTWSFGTIEDGARVFSFGADRVVVPPEESHEALAIRLPHGGDVFVLSRPRAT